MVKIRDTEVGEMQTTEAKMQLWDAYTQTTVV